MEEVLLEVDKREVVGKAVKRLRADGLVPAVIHDHGKESVHITVEYVPLLKAYQAAGKHHTVTLKGAGKDYTTLIKSADFDPKKHMLRHVVFNAVNANQTVTAEIPVHIKYAEGNDATPAERAGLVVLMQLETVDVDSLPKNLPDALYFDGEKLVAVGDHVTVGDIIVPAGVTLKTDPSHPLATVFEPSALQAANDAAGGDATDEEAVADADVGEAAASGEAEKATEKSEAVNK